VVNLTGVIFSCAACGACLLGYSLIRQYTRNVWPGWTGMGADPQEKGEAGESYCSEKASPGSSIKSGE
jgi:hypothetical protein